MPSKDQRRSLANWAKWTALILLVALIAIGSYFERQILPQSGSTPFQRTYHCYSAPQCASSFAAAWQERIPIRTGSAELVSVTATSGTLTFVYFVKWDQAAHQNQTYADGQTWDHWEEETRNKACTELNHWGLISYGGTIVHHTKFPDGETLSEIVIRDCPKPDRNEH